MPVTAKLSREFYERFGDKLVDELIGLLNEVDTTYRSELRELNELNFARFDDKLERRLTEFRSDLDRRLTDLDARWERRIGDLRFDLIKWMFLFWLGTVTSLIGIERLLPR